VKIARSIGLWILALFITLLAAHYQRTTGPTYPLDGTAKLGGWTYAISLLRTHDSDADQPVLLDIGDTTVTGVIRWKRYKFDEPWHLAPLDRKVLTPVRIAELSGEGHSIFSNRGFATGEERSVLLGWLPKQPPAGKLEYMVQIRRNNEAITVPTTGNAAITRFKGHVPKRILIPHVLCMFTGLLFGIRTLISAVLKEPIRRKALTSLVLLTIGGFLLGPFVQKYAFNAFWTGWPFGEDLTDNKTAVMVLSWAWAWWESHKQFGRRARIAAVAAAVIMMGVYLVPHSMKGSELDYKKLAEQQQIQQPANQLK